MRKALLNLTLALVGAGLAGCGGTGTGFDGGTTVGPDLAGAHLQSGTYTLSGLTAVNDGCMLKDSLPTTTQVINQMSMISIGKSYDSTTVPKFNPPGYALGTGPYTGNGTTATLNATEMVTFSDGCTETRTDTTNLQFVGMNTLSVDWQHTESNVSASLCKDTVNDPPVAGCSSEFKFTLTM